MPTELLTMGQPHTLVTNRVYALPAVNCTLYSDSTATFEQSNVFDFSTKSTITLTNGVAQVNGVWLRAPTGTPIVTLKRT